MTDGAGGVLALNKYDEYGTPAATNAGRFQYTGQMWLGETGTYNYKARTYAPHLGRFLQPDPIGYKGGINLYPYVGNDPVNFVDPLGLTGHGTSPPPVDVGPTIVVTLTRRPLPALWYTYLDPVNLAEGLRSLGGGGGGGTQPAQPVSTPQKDQCPLVRPSGNFTVGPNADPRFAPQFASVLGRAFAQLNAKGITPYITSGFRTSADQARMRGGASGSNPAASVSNHQLGLSVDLNTRTSNFPTIRAVLTGAGLTWGGTFRSKDPPHFQLPPAGTRAGRAQAAICEAENGR